MAYDKVVDSGVLDAGLTKIADAIREKTGDTSDLAFPDGMAGSLENLDHIKALKMAFAPFTKSRGWTGTNVIANGTTIIKEYNFYANAYNSENTFDGDMPDSVTTLENYCFHSCQGVNFRQLSNALTTIPEGTFRQCCNLGLEVLPDGITEIGASAFADCGNLGLTALPSSLVSIGTQAFLRCQMMKITNLPESLETIGTEAFYYCFKSVCITDFPAAIKSIGSQAFRNCFAMAGKTITFHGTPANIDSQAFSGIENVTLNVPWGEGAVANAPWGFKNATINYDYQEETA